MKRKSFSQDECTIARSLDEIGDWWSLLIVRDVLCGKRRFGELQRSLGAAKNILALRLKDLVAHDILAAMPASDGSPHKEYTATAKGRALLPVLIAIGQWGGDHLFASDEARFVAVDAATRRPLRVISAPAGGEPSPQFAEILFERMQRRPAGDA